MKITIGPKSDERVLDFPMPEGSSKKIAVFLSGGADSSIMLFMIAYLNMQLGAQHDIYPLVVRKVDGADVHANAVIQFINKKLGNNTRIHAPKILEVDELPHDKMVNENVKKTVAQIKAGEYDCVYVGDNKIPPIDFPFGEENSFPGLAPVRKGKSKNSKDVYLPFENLYKCHTIDLYYRMGVEEMLDFTHTCTERSIGRCNVCWQCGERKWAFRELNRFDPGSV